jgi:hypothetical protein
MTRLRGTLPPVVSAVGSPSRKVCTLRDTVGRS